MRYLAILALLILTSCEGPVGPQGETGPPGEPGQGGIKTTVVDLTFGDGDFSGGNGFIHATKAVPEITQAVVDRGYVTAYMEWGDGSWHALPYTPVLPGSGDFETMYWHHTFTYDVGEFTHEMLYHPPDLDVSGYSVKIRLVVVTPSE